MNRQWMIAPKPFVYHEGEALSLEDGSAPPTANRTSAGYIRWVQSALNQAMGLRLSADGVMGPMTRAAIRDFQRRQGLTADGVVGPLTEQALLRSGTPSLPAPNVINMPPIIIEGRPCELLDGFDFDRDALKSVHQQKIAQLAQRIVASQSTPQAIRTVDVTGHTDPVGDAAYNVGLGQRRALGVRRALITALEGVRRGSSSRVLILAKSRGERDPISSDNAQNRRVELCLSTRVLRPAPPPAPPQQPSRPPTPPAPATPPPVPQSPDCNRAELSRRVDACIETTRRCVIEAHENLLLDIRLDPFSNVRAMGKYLLALRRCRDALLRCDAEAKRATNCT